MTKRIKTYHLFRNHACGFDGEFSVAVVEQVFQAWAEKVNDQNVVKAFLTKVVDIWDANCEEQLAH